nr:MAG TPA: hypothetical protein [Caudoviricetes sp.]
MKISWMGLVRLFFQVNAFVAIVLAVMLLTGCLNQNSNPVEKVKIVRIAIPDNLLITCPKPMLKGETTADVAVYAVKVTDQLKICNSRILQIKNLVEDNEREVTQNSESELEPIKLGDNKEHRQSGKGRADNKK